MMENLAQILMLLSVAVTVVVAFQQLHIPTSIGYLLVGVILGPHTIGPTFDVPDFKTLAEFGVVFLLFTIGLNYSLPQLHALRHQVLGLGTAQVLLITIVVAVVVWLAGVPGSAAFVIGAVFAQSSSTIISSQLSEQGEEGSPPGRLGLAMSVFQDVTAVPFLVVIPVLGTAVGSLALAGALALAMGKAVLAFVLVFFAGRWLLRPLFQLVTRRRSAEVFTLTVLLVALLAAWTSNGLGLSLAFGAFLVGMMLGETEFRYQVESTIRPFRDVLLGLFFVGIGTLIDPGAIPDIWQLALLGAALILTSKLLLVSAMVRLSGIATLTAWRVGLMLAVGGEFGFALLAIALEANVIDERLGQIALTSVFFSMVGGSVMIRFNQAIASGLSSIKQADVVEQADVALNADEPRVLVGGYGRVGHTMAVMLHDSGIAFMAFDTDMKRVAQGQADGHQVLYGDITDPDLLATIQVERASLVVVSVKDFPVALQAVSYMQSAAPHVPVIARARDLESSSLLLAAGAAHAYPESIEASLRLSATALKVLRVPANDIDLMIQQVRDWDYKPVLEEERDDQN